MLFNFLYFRVYQTESLAAHLIPERTETFETLCKDVKITETESSGEQSPSSNNVPFLHTWFRTEDTVVFFLTNRTIQVSLLLLFERLKSMKKKSFI